MTPRPKDTNPKTQHGATKPSLHLIPGPALLHCAMSMEDGANKYGPYNWREDPVSSSTYVAGAMRHLQAWFDGAEMTSDSGVHNLGAVMANCAILLDAQAQGTLVDDRPIPGQSTVIQDALQAQKKEKIKCSSPRKNTTPSKKISAGISTTRSATMSTGRRRIRT